MAARVPPKSTAGKFLALSNIVGEPVPKSVKERQYTLEVDEGKTNWMKVTEEKLKELVSGEGGVLEYLNTINCEVINVPRDLPLEEMKAAALSIYNPFATRAVAITAEERHPLQPFGWCAGYCPVTFSRNYVLAPGKEEFMAMYKGKLFKCLGEEEHKAFIADPLSFEPKLRHPITGITIPPPPCIMLQGAVGAGKTSHATALSLALGIPVLNLQSELVAIPPPPPPPAAAPPPPPPKPPRPPKLDEEGNPIPKLDEEGNPMVDEAGQPIFEEEEEPEEEEEAAPAAEEAEEVEEPGMEDFVKVLKEKLSHEPYKSRGVILEGEPLGAEAIAFFFKLKLYPDIIVKMNVTEDICVDRIYKPPPPTIPKEPPAPYKDEEGNEVVPEPEEEVPLPEKEELVDAIKAEREAMVAAMDEMDETLEAEGIPVAVINASRSFKIVSYNLQKALRKYTNVRDGLLSSMQHLTRKEAADLIQSGHKALTSCSFKSCMKIKEAHQTQRPPLNAIGDVLDYPLRLGHYIHFHASEQERAEFCADVSKWSFGPGAPAKVVPSIFVCGPPSSGRSTLARALARDFECVRLSLARILERAVQGTSALGKRISDKLVAGGMIEDEEVIAALKMRIESGDCIKRGWVLDGFPNTAKQAQLMETVGITAQKVFFCEVSAEEIERRAAKKYDTLRESPNETRVVTVPDPKDSKEKAEEEERPMRTVTKPFPKFDHTKVLEQKMAIWRREESDLRCVFSTPRDNVHNIDTSRSKFWVHNQCQHIVANCVQRRQAYVRAIGRGEAAKVADLGGWIWFQHLEDRLGKFGRYCPVSLHSREELCFMPGNKLDYVAEYHGKFYVMAGPAELDAFIQSPSQYLAGSLPVHLPRRLTENEVDAVDARELELDGYCPVRLALGPPTRGPKHARAVRGQNNLMVEYAEKKFQLSDADALSQMMRTPWRFASEQLSKKLPPPSWSADPAYINKLPMLGYLEQTVVDVLTAGLTELGVVKPKYPFLSNKESALKYLALYLKAQNPRNQKDEHIAEKFHTRFKEFNEHCELLEVLKTPWAESGMEEEEYLQKANQYDQIKKNGTKGLSKFIS
jgi:adenylate/nucleoside-diphosphate kinase